MVPEPHAALDKAIRWNSQRVLNNGLGGQESQAMLDFAAREFEQALAKAGELVKNILLSGEPADFKLKYLLPYGCEYERNLTAKRESAKGLLLVRRAFPNLLPAVPRMIPGQSELRAPPSASHAPSSAGRNNPTARPSAPKPPRGGKKKREPTPVRSSAASAPPSRPQQPPPAKKAKPTPSPAPKPQAQRGGGEEPGSKAFLAVYLSPTTLFLGGKVYDLAAIAADFQVSVNSKCWPVLLTSKPGDAALALCPHHSKREHANMRCDQHVPPPGWNTATVVSKHSTNATANQRKEALQKSKRPPAPKATGQPSG